MAVSDLTDGGCFPLAREAQHPFRESPVLRARLSCTRNPRHPRVTPTTPMQRTSASRRSGIRTSTMSNRASSSRGGSQATPPLRPVRQRHWQNPTTSVISSGADDTTPTRSSKRPTMHRVDRDLLPISRDSSTRRATRRRRRRSAPFPSPAQTRERKHLSACRPVTRASHGSLSARTTVSPPSTASLAKFSDLAQAARSGL